VFASLVIGVANLGDVSKLSRIGGKTLLAYLITTIIAISIGLLLVNVFKPGKVSTSYKRQPDVFV
jgi:proton glutamate symport protein